MQDALYSNQNLAGILREALGLEGMSGGRSDFSCASREHLRQGLDHPSHPQTFGELEATLSAMGVAGEMLECIRTMKRKAGTQSLQHFAADFAKFGATDR